MSIPSWKATRADTRFWPQVAPAHEASSGMDQRQKPTLFAQGFESQNQEPFLFGWWLPADKILKHTLESDCFPAIPSFRIEELNQINPVFVQLQGLSGSFSGSVCFKPQMHGAQETVLLSMPNRNQSPLSPAGVSKFDPDRIARELIEWEWLARLD